MNAKEFCEAKDKELGEAWSDDYTELPKAMEEYFELKLKEVMSKKQINDMAHELWAIVSSSSTMPGANISDTVDIMIPVIEEYLAKR